MTALYDKVLAVVAAFQRWVKGADSVEIDGIALDEVRQADISLGAWDTSAPFRLAMKRHIAHLEATQNARYQSLVRVASYVVTFAVGVLSAAVAAVIMR